MKKVAIDTSVGSSADLADSTPLAQNAFKLINAVELSTSFHDFRYQWGINSQIYDTPNAIRANTALSARFVGDNTVGYAVSKIKAIPKILSITGAAGASQVENNYSTEWYNDYVRNLKTVDQQTKEDQIKNYFDFHKELEG